MLISHKLKKHEIENTTFTLLSDKIQCFVVYFSINIKQVYFIDTAFNLEKTSTYYSLS